MHSDYNWAWMPKHLLDLVSEKLESSIDYLRFGVVCTSWHSVVKDYLSERIKMSYKHNQVPMLLIPSEKQHTWNIYNAIDNQFLEPELVIPYGKRLCSSDGWLIAVNYDFTVTLHRAFSMADANQNATIHLPCLLPPGVEDPEVYREYAVAYDYHICKALITADPLENPDDSMLIVIYGCNRRLAFIRPTKYRTWTKIETNIGCLWDILYYKNEIYAVNDAGALVSCDISDSCNLKVKLVASKIPDLNYLVKRYLVKSPRGELLQVKRQMNLLEAANLKRVTKKFIVYKLDVKRSRWVAMKDLGNDVALFLGDNSSICVSISDFVGCQYNCIYFTHDDDTVGFGIYGPRDLGIYNFEDGSFNLHFTIDSTTISKMAARPPIWVVPTLTLL